MPPRAATASFKSVLCPIDFSDHSRVALLYAASLARRAGGRLTVLFVNDPLLVSAAAAAYNQATLGEASQAEVLRFVRGALRPAVIKATSLRCRTALGKPAREIARAVDEGSHDAVVVGTKGLGGARRLFVGSTTSELLRRTRVPVLAVPLAEAMPASRVPPSWPGSRIVAPIALGSGAQDDARRAADIARWFGAAIVLVHVVPEPSLPSWFGGDVATQMRIRRAKAEGALDAIRSQLGGVRSTMVVTTGHPPDEIAAITAELRAGLVVMTLRRGAGVLGAPLGSIAYHVLSHGIAPVLALPSR
jgi:nucleotide-binding universal stress UspA family protein